MTISYIVCTARASNIRWFHVKRKSKVSRETPPWTCLRDPAPPARRLKNEVVEVAGGDAGHAGGLSQRRGPDLIKLLSSFRREGEQLAVGQVGGQRERCQLREPRRGLALTRQVAVVLDLDLRREHCLGRERGADARGLEQRAE